MQKILRMLQIKISEINQLLPLVTQLSESVNDDSKDDVDEEDVDDDEETQLKSVHLPVLRVA